MKRMWKKRDVPQKGWLSVEVCDLRYDQGDGYTPAVCEMCGNEHLRFVHTLRHPKFPHMLAVGRVCAEKMQSDYWRPQAREQLLAGRHARRSKWSTRKWNLSASGNPYLNARGWNVVVFPSPRFADHWSYRITKNEDTHFSDQPFPSVETAKLAAFDRMEELRTCQN